MSGQSHGGTGRPDPRRIVTRQDFARELTLLRDWARMTVREVAKAAGLPYGTTGDYFAGRHLPPLKPARLPDILRACGVTDSTAVEEWLEALRRVRRSPGRRPAHVQAPYRGLASFQPEDAEWFFGREALTNVLVQRVLAASSPGGERVIAVVGPSGSGKSSLLRAGLVPALPWPSMLLTPGADPVGELLNGLATLAGVGVEAERRDPAYITELAERARSAAAVDISRDAETAAIKKGREPTHTKKEAQEPGERRLVVIVDQFEELLTDGCAEPERRAFIAALLAMTGTHPDRLGHPATRPAIVVIGLRADFYARALRHQELAHVLQTAQVVVGPMNEQELRRAIVIPAQKAGLELEPGLVELLLHEFGGSTGTPGLAENAHDVGALPLLSHALRATWERAQRGRLTIAGYRECGGIGGAVARTADDVYAGLSPAEEQIARRIFVRLVHIADDTGDTRRRITPDELPPGDEVTRVLDRFVEQRLITATANQFEIVHEALLVAWPRLRAWLDADRDDLRTHRRLTVAAEAWRDSGEDPGLLMRPPRLTETLEWAADSRHAADLNSLERDFLAASQHHERAEERLARRRNRRRRQITAALVALSLVATVSATVTVRQRIAADVQRDLAVSRQVAVQADKLRTKDVALAAQLSLVAYRTARTPEARSSMLESYSGPSVTRVVSSPGVLQAVAVTRDGTRMATGGTDRTVQLWAIADRGRPARLGPPLRGHPDTVYSTAFSPDGRLLASGGGGGAVFLWRLAAGSRNARSTAGVALGGRRLDGPRQTVYSVAFSPDGRTLAAASADMTVRLWDVRHIDRPLPLKRALSAPGGYAQSVAFSPDGHELAAGSADGRTRLWDLTDRMNPRPLGRPLAGSGKAAFAVAFDPDGSTLAVGSADGTVRLWSLSDRGRPVRLGRLLSGPKGWVNSVAFSPDGRRLAAASSDGNAWIWDTATWQRAALLPHPGPVTTATFPRSGTLVTSAADGIARIWDDAGPGVAGQRGNIFTTTVSADGRILATTASDSTARLWNLADPRHTVPLGPVIRDAFRAGAASGAGAMSPDARTLAVGGATGGARLWDVSAPATPRPLKRLTGPVGTVQGIAFSPDSRLLAVSGNDHKVWLWDVRDPHRPVRAGAPLTGPANYAFAPSFSPDGRILAAGSADFHVYLWDVADPARPHLIGRPLGGHTSYVFTVAFSPDGRTMATGGADSKVLLWDITDPRHPRRRGTALTGPTSYVWSVVFDGAGRQLAATAGDGTVWLWQVTARRRTRPLATVAASADAVYTDVFAGDGSLLVTAGTGSRIRLWDTDAARVAAFICSTVGTPVTAAEWRRYLPDEPYHPPCPAS